MSDKATSPMGEIPVNDADQWHGWRLPDGRVIGVGRAVPESVRSSLQLYIGSANQYVIEYAILAYFRGADGERKARACLDMLDALAKAHYSPGGHIFTPADGITTEVKSNGE